MERGKIIKIVWKFWGKIRGKTLRRKKEFLRKKAAKSFEYLFVFDIINREWKMLAFFAHDCRVSI